jgi:hypothetical protein
MRVQREISRKDFNNSQLQLNGLYHFGHSPQVCLHLQHLLVIEFLLISCHTSEWPPIFKQMNLLYIVQHECVANMQRTAKRSSGRHQQGTSPQAWLRRFVYFLHQNNTQSRNRWRQEEECVQFKRVTVTDRTLGVRWVPSSQRADDCNKDDANSEGH